ncbi:MAG: TlpA family protein disulfide reductase [Oscillospiraceae bacterium]
MDKKKTIGLIVGAVALIALILGATFAYQKLTAENTPPNSLIAMGTGETVSAESAQIEENESNSETEQDDASSSQSEAEPVAAPDFTIQDADGNAVSFSDYVGTPIVLNFWASWCPPCKSEMPDFDKVWAEYAEGGELQFMMVDLIGFNGETLESGTKYIADSGFSFPVFYDVDGAGGSVYGISSIPTTFFIDAEGNVVTYYPGAMSEDILRLGIDMILTQE